mgnify:CR=1 FL=1
MIHRSGIKTVYGCSVIVNVSFVYKMYFYSPGLCFFIVLPRFFKFSAFFSLFSSVRGIIRETSFFYFFSQFFLFPGCFSLIFLFYRPGCTFSVFYRFIWFHYNFSVFMVLIFFSHCHVLYPLFHLSGLPFSFFVNNLTFSLLSTFFIPSLRFFIPHRYFTPFSCLSLPLPPVFILFAHVYTTFSPFQSFLPFLNSFLSFLLFPPLPSFYTLFLPFFRSSFIFSFLLMSLSPSHFSRFTSLKMFHVKHRFLRFSVFGNQWEVIYFPAFRKSLSFFTSLIFKTIVFSILFWFSPFFYIFPVFSCVSRSFSSLFSLFY